MRKSILIFAVVSLLAIAPSSVFAQEATPAETEEASTSAPSSGMISDAGNFGVGLHGAYAMLGLTGKYYISDWQAVQFDFGVPGLAYGFSNAYAITAEYMYEQPIQQISGGHLFWGIGGGPGFLHYPFPFVDGGINVLNLHLSAEVGVHLHESNIELLVDYKPGYSIVFADLGGAGTASAGGLTLGWGGLAVRYFF